MLRVLILPCILVVALSSYALAVKPALPIVANEDFSQRAANWEPKVPAAWKVVKQGSESFYSMFKDLSLIHI